MDKKKVTVTITIDFSEHKGDEIKDKYHEEVKPLARLARYINEKGL